VELLTENIAERLERLDRDTEVERVLEDLKSRRRLLA
jgi:hypothetical protein